jgi:glycosyltransferase involved in cell wall biosynthesis
MFESDAICPSWVDCAQRLDKVIIPTEFNFRSFASSKGGEKGEISIAPDKLEVCPVPLNLKKIFHSDAEYKMMGYGGVDILKEFKHVFLNVSENIPRKNIEGLVRAWIDETKPEDNACLVLKLSSNFAFKLEFFGEKLRELIKEKKCAPIYFLGDFLSEKQMLSIYRQCTHYISCSFGEGWGISESICGALGKRLVVPRATAFSSYLDDQTAYLTMVSSVPAVQDGPTQQYYRNSNWYAPVTFSVKKMIRKSIKDAEAGDLSKCLAVASKLQNMCDSVKCTQKLVEIAQNIQGSTHRSSYINGASVANPVKKPTSPQEMNVSVICKSFGGKCGISDYTSELVSQFSAEANKPKFQNPLILNGDSCGYRAVFDRNDIHVINLQLEYQFISPTNLANFASYCRNSNIKLVVTLHTVNPRCYDYHEVLMNYDVKVIVSSQVMADCLTKRCGFKPENVKVIPMGISPTHVMQPAEKKTNDFRIGFFGFGYHHKGIDRLLRYMADHPQDNALILSTKPTNDQGYFDRLFQANQLSNAHWVTEHLPEPSVVRGLRSCDLIFLPYSEYGGLATSAAIRTCLKAGIPIAAFNTCFFNDVVNQSNLVKFVGNDPANYSDWSAQLTNYINELKGNRQLYTEFAQRRDTFVQDYNWTNVAGLHLDYFYEVSK